MWETALEGGVCPEPDQEKVEKSLIIDMRHPASIPELLLELENYFLLFVALRIFITVNTLP